MVSILANEVSNISKLEDVCFACGCALTERCGWGMAGSQKIQDLPGSAEPFGASEDPNINSCFLPVAATRWNLTCRSTDIWSELNRRPPGIDRDFSSRRTWQLWLLVIVIRQFGSKLNGSQWSTMERMVDTCWWSAGSCHQEAWGWASCRFPRRSSGFQASERPPCQPRRVMPSWWCRLLLGAAASTHLVLKPGRFSPVIKPHSHTHPPYTKSGYRDGTAAEWINNEAFGGKPTTFVNGVN